jgi:hypothetical protein
MGVALADGLQLLLRAVLGLVVGRGVGVDAHHVRLHQKGTGTLAHLPHQGLQGGEHVGEAGAVHLQRLHAEALGDGVDVGTGLRALGHADGIAVVLDDEEHGELLAPGVVEGLEELALGGGTLPGGDVDHLVPAVLLDGLGHAHGLEELGARAGGGGDHAQGLAGEVLAHVPAPAAGVLRLGEHVQEDVLAGEAQAHHEGLFPVVGEEPVLPRLQQHGHRDLELLVPRVLAWNETLPARTNTLRRSSR